MKKLPCPAVYPAGAGIQRDLWAGVPEQLAHPSRPGRRRTAAGLRQRPGLVSGAGPGAVLAAKMRAAPIGTAS